MNNPDPRVLFAAERTLLAWARTALSLIAFGFVLERSGALLNALGVTDVSPIKMWFIFVAGIVFMLFGAVCALLSVMQFSRMVKALPEPRFPAGYSPLAGVLINSFLVLAGLLLSVVLCVFKCL